MAREISLHYFLCLYFLYFSDYYMACEISISDGHFCTWCELILNPMGTGFFFGKMHPFISFAFQWLESKKSFFPSLPIQYRNEKRPMSQPEMLFHEIYDSHLFAIGLLFIFFTKQGRGMGGWLEISSRYTESCQSQFTWKVKFKCKIFCPVSPLWLVYPV